jgi:hypothetical protein
LSPADIADLEAADAAKAAPPTEPLPAPVPDAKTDAPPTETGEHAADSQPKRRGRKRRKSAALPPRRRMPERARALLREQLADGPKRRELIEAAAKAAEIPERSLIVAADALGVRTRRGEWWLPGP